MLQRLTIENFIRVPYLDLPIREPVLFICGPNEAGKTSIAEAIRFVFDVMPRVKYKKDLPMLVTHGGKKGAVELTFNNFSVKRNVKDGKATGDTDRLPTDTSIMSLCLGERLFSAQDAEWRRATLMRVMGVAITPAKISAELKARGFAEQTIRRYEPMYAHGLAGAQEKADRLSKEDRGAWREVTGEAYGPEKAEGWKPNSATIVLAELQKAIADLDADIVKEQTARDNALSPVLLRIQEFTQQIERPNGLPCPHCGAEVRYVGGTLVKHESTAEATRKQAEQLRTLQYQKREEIGKQYTDKLVSMSTDRMSLQRQIQDDQNAKAKEKRATELHEQIKDAEKLKQLFGDGPDGIMGRLVAQAIQPFNLRLAEIAADIGWQPVSVGGDMAIVRADQVPYALLSESAQWRADLLLHVTLSEFARFPWLIFDRVDVLDPASRVQFILWASAYGARDAGEFTMVAFATLKEKPDTSSLPGVQTEWIAGGEIAIAGLREALPS